MKKLHWQGVGALVACAVLLLGACTSGDDDDEGSSDGSTDGAEPSGEPGTGVTDDSIKIAYTFVDADALREQGIEVFHGPYGDIMQALVDDLNADGGINGRTVELVNIPYNPAGGNTEALAACAQATEDEQVFAVLGGVRGESNLCIVEQHSTALVGPDQTPEFLGRARAPWASPGALSDTAIAALVQSLDEQGSLDGKTIAVYGLAGDQANVDTATQQLEDVGADVAFEAINDADTDDRAAIDAQDATLAQRMKDEGIDAVFIAGNNVPHTVWRDNDFLPSIWVSDAGILSVFAGQGGGISGFPEILAVGTAPPQVIWDSAALQDCLGIYEEASGETMTSPDDASEDNQSQLTSLNDACSTFLIFRDAVEAAGETVNNETFQEGINSLTEIDLPGAPGSFGPDRAAAQVEFWLYEPNPDYGGVGSGDQAVLPVTDESFRVED